MSKYEIECKIREFRKYLEGILNNSEAETW